MENMDMYPLVWGEFQSMAFAGWSRFRRPIKSIMSPEVITIGESAPVSAAAQRMSDNNISCIIVTDEIGKAAGIVTERDLLRRTVSAGLDLRKSRIGMIMSTPLITISPDAMVLEAGQIMEDKKIKQLPILDGRRLIGIVTQTDLVRILTSYDLHKDVSTYMSRNVLSCQSQDLVHTVVERMALEHKSCMVCLKGDHIAGVFTERDHLKRVIALQRDPNHIAVFEVMSTPVVTVESSCSLLSASKLMAQKRMRRIVVTEGTQLVGLLTQTDVFRAVKDRIQCEENEHRKTLDQSPNGIFMLDIDARVRYANAAFATLLGVSNVEEFIGQPFLAEKFWQNPEQREHVIKSLQTGGMGVSELSLKTAAGEKRHVTLFVSITKDSYGMINGMQGMLYDITAKKELDALREMEQALENRERLLRTTLESTADGIILVDQNSDLCYMNRRFCEIWNLPQPPGEERGKNTMFTKMAERVTDREQFQKQYLGLSPATEGHRDPLTLNNGKILETYVCPYRTDGQIAGRVWSFRDVTAQKKAEQALEEERRKAVAVSEAKGRFLADISHELRAPLTTILGFGELLKAEVSGEDQKQYGDYICRSGSHLLEVINDILDLAKIEARKLEVEIQECSLDDLLCDLSALFSIKAKEKGIQFAIDKAENVPSDISTDPHRLRQCLVNLVSNAIKFTDHGKVVVSVHLERFDDQSTICFAVEDTGVGIDTDKLEKVFEPFSQATTTTAWDYGGTGLGLAITNHLIQLLGGSICVASETGKGSTFTLRIPEDVHRLSAVIY